MIWDEIILVCLATMEHPNTLASANNLANVLGQFVAAATHEVEPHHVAHAVLRAGAR